MIDKNMKNPTGIKLCISHKIATSQGPPLKSYILVEIQGCSMVVLLMYVLCLLWIVVNITV